MLRRFLLASTLMVFSLATLAAPKAELWDRWTAHVPEATTRIDHMAWDSFLKKYLVNDEGLHRMRYAAVTQDDRKALDDYIQRLSNTAISQYNRDEQLAYWINLYNATTVQLILEHYPVESITKIKSGLFSTGPWDRKLLKIEGEDVSLNDIEHRILRPIWQNPLLHYTVNCASVGCPNLLRDAYTASNAWALAKANAMAYINSPRGLQIRDGKLTVSSIYVWFKADFGGTDARVLSHVSDHAQPDLLRQLRSITKIHRHDYDWSLNDAH